MPNLRLIAVCGVTLVVAAPRAGRAQPRYDLAVDALDPQACGGSGCWTNHLRLTDLDGDGDLDLLLANYADFFNGGNGTQPLVVYANDGAGSFTNVSTAAVGGYAGSHRQIAVGDVDGDGAVDIYAPSGDGAAAVLFMNDGAGVFVNEADVRLPPGPFPQGAAARMGDVDNDGDLDIFAAAGYAVDGPPFGNLYLNDGTGTFAEVAGAIPTAISGEDIDDVEFFDADRDFDLDLVVNAHAGGTGALWLNDGTGVFSAGGSLDPPATSNFHYNVTPCDVDGDGDLDLWIDNIGGGFTEQLLINDGAGNFSDETAARVSGNPGADDNGVVCADLDLDGDQDAVVLSLGTAERLLENDGAGNFTYIAGVFPAPTNCTLWGELGDLNGDMRLDLVTAQGECSSSDEVYFANSQVPVDSLAPVVIAIEAVPAVVAAGVTPVVRFAVSDSTVTDEGPRLARAYAEIDPEGTPQTLDARFMGGDLFRVVLPSAGAAPVAFRVCARDPHGNQTCSDVRTYASPVVAPDAGPADAVPADGLPATSDAVPADGLPFAADAAWPLVDAKAADGGDATGDDGSGCGCRVAARVGNRGATMATGLLGILLVGWLRRRRGR